MEVIAKYFWLVFIGVTIANVYIIKGRVQPHIDKNPDLQEGYDLIFKNILIFGIIPWLIIGAGILSGTTDTIFDYFRPRSMNPFVLSFHAFAIIIYMLLIRWIYFKKGAEFLAAHPGVVQFHNFGETKEVTSPKMIKIFFGLALTGGMIGLLSMWFNFFGVPTLP